MRWEDEPAGASNRLFLIRVNIITHYDNFLIFIPPDLFSAFLPHTKSTLTLLHTHRGAKPISKGKMLSDGRPEKRLCAILYISICNSRRATSKSNWCYFKQNLIQLPVCHDKVPRQAWYLFIHAPGRSPSTKPWPYKQTVEIFLSQKLYCFSRGRKRWRRGTVCVNSATPDVTTFLFKCIAKAHSRLPHFRSKSEPENSKIMTLDWSVRS